MKRIKVPPFKSIALRKWVIIFFVVTACILFLGGGIASHYAAQQIEKRLNAAGCSVGSVDVNLFSQRITISAFDLNPGADSASNNIPIKAQIKNITLKTVSLYNLLINKKLKISEVIIADGSVLFNGKQSSANHQPKQQEERIKKILIGRVLIQNVNTTITMIL